MRWSKIARGSYVLMVFVLLYAPLITMVVFSFNSSHYLAEWRGFTIRWYSELFSGTREMKYIGNSFVLAAFDCIITTPLGLFAALFYEDQPRPMRRFFSFMLYLQVVIPEIVMGMSLAMFFKLTGIGLSFETVLVAHVTFSIGFFVIVFRSLAGGSLWKYYLASRDLGENRCRSVQRVMIPLVVYPLAISVLTISVLSLDNFVISYFTTGVGFTTFPIVLFSSSRHGLDPLGNAGATILLAMTVMTMGAVMLVVNFTNIRQAFYGTPYSKQKR